MCTPHIRLPENAGLDMLRVNSPPRLFHAHTEIQISTIEKADYSGTVNLVSLRPVNAQGFGDGPLLDASKA
jgi:hypothetical protein